MCGVEKNEGPKGVARVLYRREMILLLLRGHLTSLTRSGRLANELLFGRLYDCSSSQDAAAKWCFLAGGRVSVMAYPMPQVGTWASSPNQQQQYQRLYHRTSNTRCEFRSLTRLLLFPEHPFPVVGRPSCTTTARQDEQTVGGGPGDSIEVARDTEAE